MITAKGLDKKQKELLENMTPQELKEYIHNIAREYYNCIINQDEMQLKQCIVNLNMVTEMYSDIRIDRYIKFALINGFNQMLLNSANRDVEMVELKEPGLNPGTNFIFARSEIDNILDAIFYEKVADREAELNAEIEGNEDILKLFNYEDYRQ